MKCDLDVVDIGCDEEDGVDIEIENAPQYFLSLLLSHNTNIVKSHLMMPLEVVYWHKL